MIIQCASPCRSLAVLGALAVAVTAHAQQPGSWRFTAPDAAAAWFQALDDAHLAGPGAFSFYRSRGTSDSRLARSLAASGDYEILHFAPLYYPSATRQALVRATRDAAALSLAPSTPRAAFLVGALASALPRPAQRAPLAELADMVERSQPPVVPVATLDGWQRAWDTRFAVALAPYLHAERLDGGVVMVAAALGPEGRLFAGRPGDRTDNLVAVGTFDASPSADAPVFAFVRELCFPLVSRAADQSPSLRTSRTDAARRSSIAAVRCGAELLDRLLPAEVGAYRALWQHIAEPIGRAAFDTLFPPDPVLAPRIHTALAQLSPRP